MAYPHFQQVLSHSENFEPIFKALFEISFDLPPILGKTTEEAKLMLENARNITLPTTPDIEVAVQRFKYSTRAYVTLPDKTHNPDISINFNLNQNNQNSIFIWKTLKDWYDLVWNSQTGETHTKQDIIGNIIVNVHDRKGNVIRRITYHNCQITGLSEMEFSWDSPTEILECTAKFVSDYWTDLYI